MTEITIFSNFQLNVQPSVQERPLSRKFTQNSFESIDVNDIEVTDYIDPTMADDDVYYGQVYGRQGEMNFF